MKAKTFSLQKLTYFFILIFLFVYFLVIAKSILVPLAFGALFAFMLLPICRFFEKYIKWRIPAILLTMIAVLIPLSLVIFLFSAQVVDVFQDMPSIKEKISSGIEALDNYVKDIFGLTDAETNQFIKDQAPKIIQTPLSFISGGFSTSTTAAIGFFLTFLYIFLFLLYRKALKNFILIQNDDKEDIEAMEFMNKIQTIIQQYLYGLLLVIFILGILNSLGLWIIGIQYALFWGFLAASLAIIPYIGTFIGGLLPFLYAMATADYAWQPFAVVLMFILIQTIEGNLITPNVIGSSVKVNPLAAIIALLVGSQIWGVAGMILSLPSIAVLKEILKQNAQWRPVGYLLSDNISDDEKIFLKQWDEERYRLRNFFRKKE